jgi:hypothetical protein
MAKKSKAERKAEKLQNKTNVAKEAAAKKAAEAAAQTEKVEEQKTETKPDTKPEQKPEVKPEVKPETKSEQKQNPKPEQKPETTSTQKKDDKSKSKKPIPKPEAEFVEAEEVKPEEKEEKKNLGKSMAAMAAIGTSKGDRIDRNHGIELMKMIHQEYVTNPDSPKELRSAMKRQFDAMAFIHLSHWNEQTKEEFGNAGIKVSTEMFDAMSVSLFDCLGINLKGIPVKGEDGQMEIDFDATLKDAPAETKKAIENEKRIKPVKEIPIYNEKMTDEEVISSIKSIMSMKNGMENNLYNAVEFARKSFGMEKVEPAYIIATILSQLETPHVLLNSFKGMAYGSLMKSESPFVGHCRFVQKLRSFKYTENEIANIVKLFIAARIKDNAKEKEAEEKENLNLYSALLKCYDDKFVQQIMNGAKDNTKPIKLPSVKGLVMNGALDCKAIVDIIKETYGEALSDKLIKQKLSEIAYLYSTPIEPLSVYQEKAYGGAK